MRSILFYNPAVLVAAKGADHAEATLDDIRTTAKALTTSAKNPCVIRDATFFNGDLERQGDELPATIYLLGPDDGTFDSIRQAFEAVEVPIEGTDILEAKEPSKNESVEEDAVMADLKARATALGINFAPNIGENTLRGRVEAAEKARAEEEAKAEAEEEAETEEDAE